jgi:hypothetical protein
MPAHWLAAFVLSDIRRDRVRKFEDLHDLVGVRGWQPGLLNDLVAFSDDLRTRSEAASVAFRREEGAEQPESVARTALMITHPRGKLGVCAVGSSGRAQSPRGAAASKSCPRNRLGCAENVQTT